MERTQPAALISGWICPAHPEIIWDAAGKCPRCRLELEPGTLPEAETRPAPPSPRRWFLKMGFALLSGLFWLACRPDGNSRTHETYDPGYGGGTDYGMMGMGMMGGRGMMGGMMGGRGMMGGGMCPMCGQSFREIPGKLPTPKSGQWLGNLREVLALERLSLVQYRTDEDKFQVRMPYMMVIPQEENHIQWITELFSAYGLSAAGPTPAIKRSQTVTQAYEIAMGLEADLIPRYEWLITNAEGGDSRQVINPILFQTRMHYNMFNHALRMGGMMGPGMMGPGRRR